MNEVCHKHAGIVTNISNLRRDVDGLKEDQKETIKIFNNINIKFEQISAAIERIEEKVSERVETDKLIKQDIKNIKERLEELETFRDQLKGMFRLVRWISIIGGSAGGLSLLTQILKVFGV